MSLRSRLKAVLAAAVIPLILLIVGLCYAAWREHVRVAERAVAGQAELAAARVEAVLAGARQAAAALVLRVQDEGFAAGACTTYVQALVAAEPSLAGAAIAAPDGRVWCHDQTSAAPPDPVDRDLLRVALETTQPVIGAAGMLGADTQVVPLALSWQDSFGRPLGVAILRLDLARAARRGPDVAALPGFVAVADRHGAVVGQDTHAALTLPPELMRALAQSPRGVLPETTHNGRSHVAAWTPVAPATTGLTAVAVFDRAALLTGGDEALRRQLLILGVVLALALGGAAVLAGRLVLQPAGALAQAAQRRARGDAAAPLPPPVTGEFAAVSAALDAMAAQVRGAERERTAAIRHAHHRVMNSLHLLGAILHLHSRQVGDDAVRRHLDEARERVASVSVIYRHLCDCEATDSVEFAGLLRGFCEEAAEAYVDRKPLIEVDAAGIELPVELAMNLGLITHELIARAMRSATGGPVHSLRVELRHSAKTLHLEIADPRSEAAAGLAAPGRSLGMTIVQSLTRQLRGRFTVERRGGAVRFVVAVPLPGSTAKSEAMVA